MHQISMKNEDMSLPINPGLKVTRKLVDTNFGPIRSKIKVVGSIQRDPPRKNWGWFCLVRKGMPVRVQNWYRASIIDSVEHIFFSF